MGNFWADRLGGQAPPPQNPPAYGQPQAPGSWWQPNTPASVPVQPPTPAGPYPGVNSGAELTYAQLKAMHTDEMDQGQMELLATLELQGEKYNQVCDECGSGNFVTQGTRIAGVRMGTDKCFDCGNSSSTLTGSPERAVGGGSGKPGKRTKQLAGGAGNYGMHHSQLPQQFIPRGGS